MLYSVHVGIRWRESVAGWSSEIWKRSLSAGVGQWLNEIYVDIFNNIINGQYV